MNTKKLVVGFFLILCAALSGCASPYKHPANEPSAQIRYVGYGSPWATIGGRTYHLSGAFVSTYLSSYQVPVDRRITVGSQISIVGGSVHHWCRPGLTFIPKANHVYVLNAAMVGYGKCAAELFLEDPTSDIGVTWESSVEPLVPRR